MIEDYTVWVLGEEFTINAYSRYNAAAKGVREYLERHPNSKYNWSQLMTIVRTKRMKLNLFGEL